MILLLILRNNIHFSNHYYIHLSFLIFFNLNEIDSNYSKYKFIVQQQILLMNVYVNQRCLVQATHLPLDNTRRVAIV